jgi:hypothetical protein
MIKNVQPVKTYATAANAENAALRVFGKTDLRYLIAVTNEGRFYPVFIGEEAGRAMVHFHFSVVG